MKEMSKIFSKRRLISSSQGFSLVELSIVIMIIGLLMTGGLSFYSSLEKREKAKVMKRQFQAIEVAIENYIDRSGVLPCPASLSAKTGEKSLGAPTNCKDEKTRIGTCTKDKSYCIQGGRPFEMTGKKISKPMRVRVGTVPARALNIPLDMMKDQWGNYILYAATELLTRSPAYFNEYDGGIGVVDDGGHSLITPEQSATYVLISHGANEAGAHIYGHGSLSSECPYDTQADGINCDIANPKAMYRQAAYSVAGGSGYFDDHVFYTTKTTHASGLGISCRDYPICTEQNIDAAPVCRVRGGSDGVSLCVQREDLRGGPDINNPYEHDITTWKDACDIGENWRKPTLAELRALYENRADIGGFQSIGFYLSRSSYNPVLVGNDDRKLEIWAMEFGKFSNVGSSGKTIERRINISPNSSGRSRRGYIRCIKR